MYTTYIRPIIESNINIWCPHLLKDINLVERDQKKNQKVCDFFVNHKGLKYVDRLTRLQLQSLEWQRTRFDLLFDLKKIHGLIDMKFEDKFTYNLNRTRGHQCKCSIFALELWKIGLSK